MPAPASTGAPSELPQRRRAATLIGPKEYEVSDVPLPECKPHEVLVKIEGCGICGSSLPVWEGRPWFEYPRAPGSPGHEGWGHVASLGSEVIGLSSGQRVAFLSDNAFADFEAVAAERLVPLPRELDGIPFPGEAIGCAMNIFERADIRAGQNVAIIGAGFLGLLLVELAQSAGATVFALSRRSYARELALSCGASEAFDTEDWWGNAHEIVRRTADRGCERVIEVTGLQFALDTATELISEYGKLIIAGFHQDGLRQVNMQKWNWRGIDVINAHERNPQRYVEGMRRGVSATVEGRIHPARLLTHSYSLEHLSEGFQAMVDRPDGFIKGWVHP